MEVNTMQFAFKAEKWHRNRAHLRVHELFPTFYFVLNLLRS